jgi:HlyD family secretion protein
MKRAFLMLLLVAAGITVYGYLNYSTSEFIPEIRTVNVTQGDVVDTVGATGALEAVTTVNVGSQVSGIIQNLFVDYNSIVREGDVIMRLDPSLFETQLEQARANLVRAEAEVERFRVALDDSRVQLRRSEDLAERELISRTELEAAQVAVRLTEAQLKSTEAAVTQAEASLNQNQVNLDHTVIRAPIDGIVISRLVDIGQTVAASLQAPELFVIAADLTKMRVIAAIDESDVGRIRPNQRVTFTVDAFPGEEFEGIVSQIRLEPVVTQNVVTYATVVDAPNPNLRLKPGMTATITLEIARRENILRIPNAALRFRPTAEVFALLDQPVPASLQQGGATGRPSTGNTGGAPPAVSGPAGAPGGGGFGGAGERGAPDPERMRQMRERMTQMSPEEREQFFAERRAAGGGPGGDGRGRPGGVAGSGSRRRPANAPNGPNIPTVDRGATTIDALFGALPPVESTGRVWVMNGDRLEEVNVRLGVTDGTATVLLGVLGEQPQAEAPAVDPQVALLREQLGAIQDETARATLERTIEQIEARSRQQAPTPRAGRSLPAGVQLVTNITTPDNGPSAPSGGSGSPLIPQFGRRRR